MAENKRSFIERIEKNPIIRIVIITSSIFGLISFFVSVRTKSPNLEFVIENRSQLLNPTDSISSLEVRVDSIDLYSSRQNISVFAIKIVNTGRSNITEGLYSSESMFGLSVKGGTIVDAPVVVNASSPRLIEEYKTSHVEVCDNFCPFPKLLLDANEYYIVHLIIMHSVDTVPYFTTHGKISGQDYITIYDRSDHVSREKGIKTAVKGRFMVQILRLLIYGYASIIVLIIAILIINYIIEIILSFCRWVKVMGTAEIGDISHKIITDYVKHGKSYLEEMYTLLSSNSEKDINEKYNKSDKYLSSPMSLYKGNSHDRILHTERLEKYNEYIKDGYLTKVDGIISIEKQRVEDVKILLERLS